MSELELIEERKAANQLLVNGLRRYFKQYADMRFIQGLWDLQLVSKEDKFYEEPVVTLEKLNHFLPEFFHLIGEDKEDEVYADLMRVANNKDKEINNLNQRLVAKEVELATLKKRNEELLKQLFEVMKKDRDMLEDFVRKLIDNECYTISPESLSFKAEED